MGRKSKSKPTGEQEVAETQEHSTAGITEVPKEANEPDADLNQDLEEEPTLLQKFFNKVSTIPPLRLILFALTLLYLVKNYMSARTDYVAPALPADHEQRMAEQRERDLEKYWMYGKYILVSGGLFITMRIINDRAESKLPAQKQSPEEETKPKNN